MADEITTALDRWTDDTIASRLIFAIERGDLPMPLEIRGLKGKALKAAANLDRLNQAYDAFNEAAPAHAADVEGLTPQITELQDDLHFATQVLGNSVNGFNAGDGQEKPKEPPAEKQVITSTDVGKIDQAIVSGSPAPVPPPLVNTFRAEAESQIAAGQGTR